MWTLYPAGTAPTSSRWVSRMQALMGRTPFCTLFGRVPVVF